MRVEASDTACVQTLGEVEPSRRPFSKTVAIARPLISIIIPAHNEENYLDATLDAIDAQTFSGYEVLVVPNGCSDHTSEVARSHRVRVLEQPEKGLGRARNLGASKARGELLLFLDADTVLEPQALETIVGGFPRQAAVGTIRGQPDGPCLSHHCIYWLKNHLHQSQLHHGSSGVILCWRDIFTECSGFDETLEMRENSEFIRRAIHLGPYQYVGAAAAVTSMRRYQKRGTWAVLWQWTRIWFVSLFSSLRHRRYDVVR